MNKKIKRLKHNIKQAENEYTSAIALFETIKKGYTTSRNLLLRDQFNDFKDKQSCIQIKANPQTIEDCLFYIFNGNAISRYNLDNLLKSYNDNELKYCSFFRFDAQELPYDCKNCPFNYNYDAYILYRDLFYNAESNFDQKKSMLLNNINNAKLELENYKKQRRDKLFAFFNVFSKQI